MFSLVWLCLGDGFVEGPRACSDGGGLMFVLCLCMVSLSGVSVHLTPLCVGAGI